MFAGYSHLLGWVKDFVVNYDDLTYSQKYRLRKVKYLGVGKRGRKKYGALIDYAKLKSIKVRMPLPNDNKKYRLVTKTVICELL